MHCIGIVIDKMMVRKRSLAVMTFGERTFGKEYL